MIPTRFSWRYGGHQVLLGVSFDNWRPYPMTPVEGSTTIFQAICNLPPGLHQYKFLVDGMWRHDEHLPQVMDENGMTNNVILVRELELFPPVLPPGPSPIAPNVSFNNGVYDGLLSSEQESTLRITDADINLVRQHFTIIMSRYTAYELLPDSGKVFVVDVNTAMKQAFHIMYEQGLVVVPILDSCTGQLAGMLTAADFILILKELHKNGSMLTKEELDTHSVLAWKEGKHKVSKKHAGYVRRSLIQASPYDSLKDLAIRIVQNDISTVPIVYSSVQDGSCLQLLHVACLAGILRYICRHFRHSPGSLPLLQQPIFRIPIGTWMPNMGRESGRQLALLHSNSSLSSALTLLMEAHVSSIPVVDDNGSLLDQYSRSDITALARGGAYAQIHPDRTSIHQALQLTYEANAVNNGPRRCQTCLRSDSLFEVMERLSDPAVRRLIIVDPGSRRVEGIISIRDVFNFLLS